MNAIAKNQLGEIWDGYFYDIHAVYSSCIAAEIIHEDGVQFCRFADFGTYEDARGYFNDALGNGANPIAKKYGKIYSITVNNC